MCRAWQLCWSPMRVSPPAAPLRAAAGSNVPAVTQRAMRSDESTRTARDAADTTDLSDPSTRDSRMTFRSTTTTAPCPSGFGCHPKVSTGLRRGGAGDVGSVARAAGRADARAASRLVHRLLESESNWNSMLAATPVLIVELISRCRRWWDRVLFLRGISVSICARTPHGHAHRDNGKLMSGCPAHLASEAQQPRPRGPNIMITGTGLRYSTLRSSRRDCAAALRFRFRLGDADLSRP